jgi:hypothetical protein
VAKSGRSKSLRRWPIASHRRQAWYDTRLARGLGWGQAEDFFVSLRDNFDALHREGEQTPKMMTVALHCRLAGKPARAAAFARFVDH